MIVVCFCHWNSW